jgi:hemolysin III
MGLFKMKEPASTWIHFVMFLGGIAGLVLLILKARQSPSQLITALIFGTSIITLYGASSLYHWIRTTRTS